MDRNGAVLRDLTGLAPKGGQMSGDISPLL